MTDDREAELRRAWSICALPHRGPGGRTRSDASGMRVGPTGRLWTRALCFAGELSGELAASALGRIQMGFIISEIGNTEKMTVEKADLDAEFAKIKDEKVKKQQQSDPRYIDAISQSILRNKVADYLLTIK